MVKNELRHTFYAMVSGQVEAISKVKKKDAIILKLSGNDLQSA